MLKQLKNYLSKRKFRPVGTQEITWTNGGEISDRCSATFYINDLNKRKVKFDYAKPVTLHKIKNHPWYHGAIVPFLQRTGWAAYCAAHTERLMIEYFYKIDAEEHIRAQKSPLLEADTDNVIIFPRRT